MRKTDWVSVCNIEVYVLEDSPDGMGIHVSDRGILENIHPGKLVFVCSMKDYGR